MTAAVNQGTKNNLYSIDYARNARWAYWAVLLVDISGFVSAFALIQTRNIPQVYNLILLELAIVPLIYTIGYLFILRDRVPLGISIIAVTYGLAFTSFTISFDDLGFIDTLIIGIGIWQMAILTLPYPTSSRLITFGVILALFNLIADIYIPYNRFLLRETRVFAPITVGLVITLLSILFWTNYRRYDLRTKFIFAMVGIAILASLTTYLGISATTRSQSINSSIVTLQNYSRAQSQLIEDFIEIQFATLSGISQNSGIVDEIERTNRDLTSISGGLIPGKLFGRQRIWDDQNSQFLPLNHVVFFDTIRNPAADRLRTFKNRNFQNGDQLFVVNKFGSLVAMTTRGDTGEFIHTQTDWWPVVSGEITGVSDVYIGFPQTLSNGTAGIPIAVPIFNRDNIFVGAVHGIIPVNDLVNHIEETLADDQGNIELAILFNQQILPLDGSTRFTQAAPFSPETLETLIGNDSIQTEYNGELAVLSASQTNFSENANVESANQPWTIIASQTQASIDSLVVAQQRLQTFIGVAVIFVATIIAIVLARLVSSPILRLATVAERLESGELSARADISTYDEIGLLASSFNGMAEQSQQLVNRLETRVAERTQFLETSFRVSQSLSSITEKDQLLQAVVDQLQSSFDYYHVHVYLLNQGSQRLELVAGSGDVGKQLLQQNHSLPIGTGLVGQAALNNLSVLIPNVEEEEKWVPNRLLPETKSEMSIPISIGDSVLGVIDVQEDKIDRLQLEDVDLVQSIARQVAVALRNVDQIHQIRKKAEQEAKINQIREQINSTTKIEDAIKIAAKELGSALNSKDTMINLQLQSSTQDEDTAEHEIIQIKKLLGKNGRVNQTNGTK